MNDRPSLRPEQLLPGDVLLSNSSGVYAQVIRFVTDSAYNHAGLWTGHDVIESVPADARGLGGGVVQRSLAESLSQRAYVDVFRWNGHTDASLEPVVKAAEALKQRPYGLPEITMMAYCVKHHLRWGHLLGMRSDLRERIRVEMENLRAGLGVTEHVGLTCAELVVRAYSDADPGPARRYALRFRIGQADVRGPDDGGHADDPSAPPPDADPELVAFVALCEQLCAQQDALRVDGRPDTFRAADGEDEPAFPVYLLGPGDLARSEDLIEVGRLDMAAARLWSTRAPASRPSDAPVEASPVSTREPGEPSRAVDESTPVAAPIASTRRLRALLYVAASPASKPVIHSDDEYEEIRRALLHSGLRLGQPILKASVGALAHELRAQGPDVVHFASHGERAELVVHNRAGGELRLGEAALRDLLSARRPRLLVLMACDTAELAASVADCADIVIGLRGRVRQSEANRFSAQLYESLAAGESVAAAFAHARYELGTVSGVTPVLLAAPGASEQAFAAPLRGGAEAPPKEPVAPPAPAPSSAAPTGVGRAIAIGVVLAALVALVGGLRLLRAPASDVGTQAATAPGDAQAQAAPPPTPALDLPVHPETESAPSTARAREATPDRALATAGSVLVALSGEARSRDGRPRRFADGCTLHAGDQLRLSLTPLAAAFVYLVHVSPGGAASLLYSSEGGPLANGRRVQLPPAGQAPLILDDELGAERLVLFASPRPLAQASPRYAAVVRAVQAQGALPDDFVLPAPPSAPSVAQRDARGLYDPNTAKLAIADHNGLAIASLTFTHAR